MNKNVKISDVTEDLNLDEQRVLKGMLAKASISDHQSIVDFITAFTYGSQLYNSLTVEEKRVLLPLVFWDKDRFAAKLTFEKRCQILALRRADITRELLAKAYGVNRRTITHIYNPKSKHYKDVREEEHRLGKEEFRKKYASQDVMDFVMSYRQLNDAKPEKSNRQANRKSGPHTVRGPYCEYDHRVVIAWKDEGERANDQEEIEEAGWYFNDLDGDFPDCWMCDYKDPASSIRTSDACYRMMFGNIYDRTGNRT